MAIIVDEAAGTISFTDCTVTFPYGFSVSSGVGTIIITPAGGVASFPMAIQGNDGPPPDVRFVYHELASEDPLPSPNPVRTVLDPGGPGEASVYQFDLYGHEGTPGAAAPVSILAATDIDGTVTDGYVLAKKSGIGKVEFIPMRVCDLRGPDAIAATSFSNTSPRVLRVVALPARPFPRKVLPYGAVVVTGSVDTRVDIVAYLGDPTAGGVEVGRAFGAAGAAPPPTVFAPGPPSTMDGANDSYAVIVAGSGANIYYRAEQVASSSNGWATAAGPGGARLGALAIPV